MNIEETFAERLAQARNAAVLTQEELAQRCSITQTQISRYEKGKAFPRPATMRSLAEALGVAPEWLSKGEGRGKQVRIALQNDASGAPALLLQADKETERNFKALAAEAGKSPEHYLLEIVLDHVEKARDRFLGAAADEGSQLTNLVKRLDELEGKLQDVQRRAAGETEPLQTITVPLSKK